MDYADRWVYAGSIALGLAKMHGRLIISVVCAFFFVTVRAQADGPVPDSPAATQSSADSPDALWRKRVRGELGKLKAPALPHSGADHPVDSLLDAYWQKQSVPRPALCDDGTFLRRVHLDLIGLLPSQETLHAFESDQQPDKRQRLVDKLLSNRQAYAEHWMTFWNDLLRNDEAPLLEAKRRSITPWLYQSLLENKPYDLFAAELIAPSLSGPVGFIQGIDWQFSVSASEVPPMQAARSVSQVFQGVNLKCASCHDSFSGQRKLDEAWNLAACFAEVPLESYRCDKPTGHLAKPQFLFQELGKVAADAPLESRREAVAVMATQPANPRFAKVIVNRLFRQLFGQGLIESVDDFDGQQSFSPDLLDYLAYDFMSHDYDIKHTLRRLATSRAYQSKLAGEQRLPLPLRAKRLTAEQFADAVATLTECWPKSKILEAELGAEPARTWRAVNPDALATALGRPNREVINSTRQQSATPLQALELISGSTLQKQLACGADKLLAGPLGQETDTEKIVRALCRRAYARNATTEEIEQGRQLLGKPGDAIEKRRAGWEDFLWLIVMSHEFQYAE